MSVPSVNIKRITATCGLHDSDLNKIFTSCGSWSHGYTLAGPGVYGLLIVDREKVVMNVKDKDGNTALTMTVLKK